MFFCVVTYLCLRVYECVALTCATTHLKVYIWCLCVLGLGLAAGEYWRFTGKTQNC